jgi:flavin reductase (DIM6/NTAB) family NADH-FMN oxidoreductase RutF
MTLSSFTTLTLTPSPVITFNIKRPSRTLDALYQSRHFLIHVLEASESGARVAERFTRGNKGGNVFLGKDDFEVGGLVVQNEGMGGEGRGDVVLPRLRAEGVVSVLRCEILGNGNQDMEKNENGRSGLVSVGDHVLVLGKVHEILGAEEGNGEGKHGLCYADGRYRRIGDVIEVEEKGY